MGVIGHSSVDAFFREILLDSLQRQGLSAGENTEYYLVGLLGNYAKGRQITDEPLSLKLCNASDEGDRVSALKVVGDTSLYVTGFFSRSLQRQLVQADYYMSLGSAAYRELAGHLEGSSAREVYDELASKFPAFVDVLADIRSQINFAGTDVVSLYEEWLHSRSEWIEDRLRRLGVMMPGSEDDLIQ